MRKKQFIDGIVDYQGNKVYLADSGSIYIRLKSGEKKKMAALKVSQGEEYIEITKKENQIFYKNNSWGFNWDLISHLPENMVIHIRRTDSKYKKVKYKLTVEKIKELGSFLHFMGEGFEKQIFVPINNFYRDM